MKSKNFFKFSLILLLTTYTFQLEVNNTLLENNTNLNTNSTLANNTEDKVEKFPELEKDFDKIKQKFDIKYVS